jgi:hypothetical protein
VPGNAFSTRGRAHGSARAAGTAGEAQNSCNGPIG